VASPPRADSVGGSTAGPGDTATTDRLPLAVGLDVAMVTLFVAVGRRTHDEDPAISGLIETAAPFLIGLGVGWLVARAWRHPASVRTGLVIWAVTVVAGMVLRHTVFDEGTATSFVIVASAFLGATIVGWRLAVAGFDARRRRRGKLAA
jgi:Protein of unknown function (DUF3054)